MITDNIILWGTNYGNIHCKLEKMLMKRNLSAYQLARLADVKYDIIRRYCDNEVLRYDARILSKLCYALCCNINDLLEYKK